VQGYPASSSSSATLSAYPGKPAHTLSPLQVFIEQFHADFCLDIQLCFILFFLLVQRANGYVHLL
jgi:hypothetical protein